MKKTFVGSLPPLGYTRRKTDGRLVPALYGHSTDLKEIEGLYILKYIFYMAIFGASYRQIARSISSYFNKTRKNRGWNDHSKIQSVIENPIYIGLLRGTCKDGHSYLIDDANVEKIISPTIFFLLNQKSKYVKRGRTKKVLNRLFNMTICFNCGNPLVKDGEKIKCEECNKYCLNKNLIEVIQRKTHDQQNSTNDSMIINDLINRYKVKIENLTVRLKSYENLINKIERLDETKETITILKRTIEIYNVKRKKS